MIIMLLLWGAVEVSRVSSQQVSDFDYACMRLGYTHYVFNRPNGFCIREGEAIRIVMDCGTFSKMTPCVAYPIGGGGP